MGAQLIIETRFASRTNSITETTERLKCIVNAASSETSVGAETQDVDVEVSGGAKGVSATASTTIKGLKAGYTSGHASKDQKYVYYDTEGPRLYLDIDYRNRHKPGLKKYSILIIPQLWGFLFSVYLLRV